MADPLSITTAIATLLGTAGSIGKVLKKVVNLRKDAPDILLAVNNEITELRAVIQMFDDLLQRQYTTSDAAPYGQLSVSLEKAKQTLLRLDQLFLYELTVIDGNELHLRLDKSAWLRAEPKFRAINDQIRDDKTALFRGLAVVTYCMTEYMSRSLHLSVKTFEERMLQAHDHVIEELQILRYAVQNVSHQQNRQDQSLRRTRQDTALIYQQFQHDVERTTALYQKSGRITFGEHPIEVGSRSSNVHQDSDQLQLSRSIERGSFHSNTEETLHPVTKPSSRRFHAARLSPNHIEPSDPNLPSSQLQNSMTPLHMTTSQCGSDCCCSCHRRSRFRSPSLFGNVIGSLSVRYHASPSAAPTCDSPSCRHRSKMFTYNYTFPQWLWNRILLAHLAYSQGSGPEFCLRLLRVRPNHSPIIKLYCGYAQIDEDITTKVKRLLKNGEASVLDVDENGTSILCWAVRTAHYHTAKLLIDHGADCYHEDSFGWSPFTAAWTLVLNNTLSSKFTVHWRQLFSDQSHFDSFRFTQLHKAYLGIAGNAFDTALASTQRPQVDERDATGRTTLHWACARGDHLAISQLLNKGANPNVFDHIGRTPLHRASVSTSIESMKLLLAAGADKELRDEDGNTPLAICSLSSDIDSMKLLWDAEANIESQDRWLRRPLHYAARLNRPQVAKFLIERGADFEAKDESGLIPFEIAVGRPSKKAIFSWFEPKSYAILDDGEILFFAALYANEEWLKTLRSLAIVRIDLRVKDEDGMTALEVAEWRRDNSSTCSKGSTSQAPKRNMRAWFEAFKALWDDIETRQERMSINFSNYNDVLAHDADVEFAGEWSEVEEDDKEDEEEDEEEEDEEDENNQIWEDAPESQDPAPA